MERLRAFASLAVAVFALSGPASAHELQALSADVTAVVTGGSWSSGSLNGVYRVVVRTGGLERTDRLDCHVQHVRRRNSSRSVKGRQHRLMAARSASNPSVWQCVACG